MGHWVSDLDWTGSGHWFRYESLGVTWTELGRVTGLETGH